MKKASKRRILFAARMATMVGAACFAVSGISETLGQEKEKSRPVYIATEEVAETTYMPEVEETTQPTETAKAAVACIIGSNSINSKRNAAIATAYKISEAALNDYKAKVVESIGEKKEQIIQEKVTQDKIDSNPPTNTTVIMAGNGDQLFYDGVSGRYFNSTIEKVDAAINTINRTMTYEMYVSLSEFYDELGLEHTDVSDECIM